jgi:hypothetical protein
MNDLEPELLIYILEIIARDIVRECNQINDIERRLCVVDSLSEYARLCLVNQRFYEFMSRRVRVDGKLLKLTLMDLSVSHAAAFITASVTLMSRNHLRIDAERIAQIRKRCGVFWKNLRLWDVLPSLLRFCDKFFDAFRRNTITPTILYWVPITFKSRIVRNPYAGWTGKIGDFLQTKQPFGTGALKCTTGISRIEIPDEKPLIDVVGRRLNGWIGVSLTEWEGEEEWCGEPKEAGGSVQEDYWLWYRRCQDPLGQDARQNLRGFQDYFVRVYYIVDYARGMISRELSPSNLDHHLIREN